MDAYSDDGTVVRAGQVWKERRNKPECVFLVLEVFVKQYPDGRKRTRVNGVLSSGSSLQPDRGLDIESLRSMFPVLMFEPQKPEPVEDK